MAVDTPMTRVPGGRSDSALILFTLAPEAEGRRKCLGPARRTAAVFAALIDHVQRSCSGIPGLDLLIASPERLNADSTRHLPQRGRDFGESLRLAFDDAFAMGYRRVLVIGNDAPEISPAYIRHALARLERDERAAVLGPAGDGGYALLGLGARCPGAFENIAWGGETVAADTETRLSRLGFAVLRLLD